MKNKVLLKIERCTACPYHSYWESDPHRGTGRTKMESVCRQSGKKIDIPSHTFNINNGQPINVDIPNECPLLEGNKRNSTKL